MASDEGEILDTAQASLTTHEQATGAQTDTGPHSDSTSSQPTNSTSSVVRKRPADPADHPSYQILRPCLATRRTERIPDPVDHYEQQARALFRREYLARASLMHQREIWLAKRKQEHRGIRRRQFVHSQAAHPVRPRVLEGGSRRAKQRYLLQQSIRAHSVAAQRRQPAPQHAVAQVRDPDRSSPEPTPTQLQQASQSSQPSQVIIPAPAPDCGDAPARILTRRQRRQQALEQQAAMEQHEDADRLQLIDEWRAGVQQLRHIVHEIHQQAAAQSTVRQQQQEETQLAEIEALCDQSYYALAGVPMDAPVASIRAAMKKQLFRCHPDKIRYAKERATAVFQKVSEANETLLNEQTRAAYNASLLPPLAQATRCPDTGAAAQSTRTAPCTTHSFSNQPQPRSRQQQAARMDFTPLLRG